MIHVVLFNCSGAIDLYGVTGELIVIATYNNFCMNW